MLLWVGTPALIIGLLSSLQIADVTYAGIHLRFIGTASSDALLLAISVIIMFAFTLTLNFAYDVITRRENAEAHQLYKNVKRAESYEELREEFRRHIAQNEKQKAFYLGAFLLEKYPEFVEEDTSIVTTLIDLGHDLRLVDGRPASLLLSKRTNDDRPSDA